MASAILNMTVLAPCDPAEMHLATRWCGTVSAGPVYMRLGKAGEPDLSSTAAEPFEVGMIRYLTRGRDIAIVSSGITTGMAMEICRHLTAQGRSVSTLSCHTLKPLDRSGIQRVLASHNSVVVIEEHVPHGGLGSRVKEIAWDMQANCRLDCFSLKDEFIHFYGTHAELLQAHSLSVRSIVGSLS